MALRLLALVAVLCSPGLLPGTASARKSQDFTHRYEQVWSAAVRMVRVDLRFQVRDQDPSIGYVLFDYRDTGNRTSPGSIELVRVQQDGRPAVRVVVQVPQKPSYIEQMLIDRLERKLREEFGEPPPPPERPDPPAEEPEEDEGEEGSDEGSRQPD